MRIALFSDTFSPQINGVAHVVASSAEALRKRGHEVKVFSVHDTISFPLWGQSGERIALPIGQAYRKALAFKPNIIHSHTPFGIGWEAVMVSKKLKIPLVGTHHTFFDHYLKYIHMNFSFMEHISWKYMVGYYNQCDIVLCPSKALFTEMNANGIKKKSLVFANAINTNFFLPVSNEEKNKLKKRFGISGFSIIYMGRLSYEKSIDQILSAFKIIKDVRPNIKLLVVGDGPERKKLENQSKKLNIVDAVTFTGMLRGDDLREAMQASDIFMTASKSENMPISVLEAMSTGLPAIGVDSLGMPEVINNEKNGFIVPPNDMESMAKKALLLLEKDDIRNNFSKESRNISLNFGEEENARKLEDIYNSLLKQK